MLIRTSTILCISMLMCGTVLAETPADPASADHIRIGDQWSYDLTDNVTGDLKATLAFTVSNVTDAEITTRVTKRGDERNGLAVFDSHWNVKDDGAFRHKPRDGSGIELPLNVGKEWKSASVAQNLKTGESFKLTSKAKVVAQEQVTTQAGSYDTFKIVTETRETFSNDLTKHGDTKMETWYAPAVNRFVKRTVVTTFAGRVRANQSLELIDYTRQPE